ncbi:MAG TPA: membrane dipeptidase, partial [Thermomicrobiales bacterium]|nr:membrane dipeptidase [Thermomicrobiales bacterium]
MTDSTGQPPIPVFDGHNDTLLSLIATGRSFYERSETGHIDRPRAHDGGLIGGFFAIFVPSLNSDRPVGFDVHAVLGNRLQGIELSTDDGPSLAYAQQFAFAQIARLLRIESGQDGMTESSATSELSPPLQPSLPDDPLTIVLSAADLADNIERGNFSAILHFEGAEMIDENLDALEVFHAAGLRSLGPVWS